MQAPEPTNKYGKTFAIIAWLILMVLLFPAVGAGIAWAGWKMRSNYQFFGPTPLQLDPEPGHAGGQVGGSIHLGKALPRETEMDVWLSCIRGRESGSGKDRKTVTYHEVFAGDRHAVRKATVLKAFALISEMIDQK